MNLCKSYTKKACSCYYSVTEKPIKKEQANENKINESTILWLLWSIKTWSRCCHNQNAGVRANTLLNKSFGRWSSCLSSRTVSGRSSFASKTANFSGILQVSASSPWWTSVFWTRPFVFWVIEHGKPWTGYWLITQKSRRKFHLKNCVWIPPSTKQTFIFPRTRLCYGIVSVLWRVYYSKFNKNCLNYLWSTDFTLREPKSWPALLPVMAAATTRAKSVRSKAHITSWSSV